MRTERFFWDKLRKEYLSSRGLYGFWFEDKDFGNNKYSVFSLRHCTRDNRRFNGRSGDYRSWKQYRQKQYKTGR